MKRKTRNSMLFRVQIYAIYFIFTILTIHYQCAGSCTGTSGTATDDG